VAVLADPFGVKRVIEVGNILVRDATVAALRPPKKPERIFISRAQNDGAKAKIIARSPTLSEITVVFGDEAIHKKQDPLASISNALLGCDACVVLWTRDYALSPVCYDELSLAMSRQRSGEMPVWFFDMDGTPIVPKEFRRIRGMKQPDPEKVAQEIHALIAKS
jgi:hypothetical protein